jgi:hypothetical protein
VNLTVALDAQRYDVVVGVRSAVAASDKVMMVQLVAVGENPLIQGNKIVSDNCAAGVCDKR